MNVRIRQAVLSDLPAINQLIELAVMKWQLPERVKRLSLPSYQYNELDFRHMRIFIAENDEQKAVGIYTLDEAGADFESSQLAFLLHGIYVLPDCQRQGIGEALFRDAENRLKHSGDSHLLVKAQPGAISFFQAQGMKKLPAKKNRNDYPHFFHKEVTVNG